MLPLLRRHLKFIALLLVFTVVVLVLQTALPVLEGSDETLHANYVLWLRSTGTLPDRATYETNSTRQESGQPPLTYWVAAKVLDALRVPIQKDDLLTSLELIRNRWFTPPDWSNRADNFNQYYHGYDEQAFGQPDVVRANRVTRYVSLFFALLAVIGAYGLAREVFPQERWALTATAFYAFTPTMLYLGANFSNDVSAAALATLALWQTFVMLRRGASPARLIVVGMLIGLAGLSKISAMLILPGVLLAVLFAAHNRSFSAARTLAALALIVGVITLLFGPWVAYGQITFDDPFELRTHHDAGREALPLPTLEQVVRELPNTFNSYWAKFGSSTLWMSPAFYVLFTALVLLAVIGTLRYTRRGRLNSVPGLMKQRIAIAATVVILALAALLYWLVTLFPVAFAITGRLIYFVHGLVTVAMVGGLYLLSKNVGLRLLAVGTVMGAGLIAAPITVWNAYAPPRLLAMDQLPALQGMQVDFDHTIRFLGYAHASSAIYDNVMYTTQLCWQVLKPTTRDGAFDFKVFDKDAQIVGGRTSIHGLGHFNAQQWHSGDIFCDDLNVPIAGPLAPGRVYNVILTMFDVRDPQAPWAATALDGTPITYPLIYQLVSPAGDLISALTADVGKVQPQNISFDGFAHLIGVDVRQVGQFRPGDTFDMKLLWEVSGKTPDNWLQFIHLIGPAGELSLADDVPRGGLYPTWAWSPGEKLTNSWRLTLPADLPAGEYMLKIGFFNPITNQRMPVSQNGKPIPDGSAICYSFVIH